MPGFTAGLCHSIIDKCDTVHVTAGWLRGVLIGGGILLVFALAVEILLTSFGISLPALRVAGGILLLLISIDMVFVRSSGGTSTTDEEAQGERMFTNPYACSVESGSSSRFADQ